MASKATFCTALVHKKLLRGTLKIKADAVCVSNDSIKIHFTGNLVSKKFYCCGYDNPYLLIERARMMTEADLIGSVGGSMGLFFGFSISASLFFWLKKGLDRLF